MNTSLTFALFRDGRWYRVPSDKAFKLSLRDLARSPVVMKIEHDEHVWYFTEDDKIWLMLQSEGKSVRGMTSIFAECERRLQDLGFNQVKIIDWSLDRLFHMQTILETLPGTKLVSVEL